MRRVLVVDDETGIRETLSEILRLHGFETAAAGTVTEALSKITTELFDVLISDLNIGEPGDGFTVVSAMRRVQPKCRTFILTGYPAFDTAMKAIRSQVDDYIVKPANIPSLIASIERKLEDTNTELTPAGKRLSRILLEHSAEIVSRTLSDLKANPRMAELTVDDHERVDHIPLLLQELSEILESARPGQTPPRTLQVAAKHGRTRAEQRFTPIMLIAETRILERAISDTIQDHLLSIDMSSLVQDLKWLNESVFFQLEETLLAFTTAKGEDLAA